MFYPPYLIELIVALAAAVASYFVPHGESPSEPSAAMPTVDLSWHAPAQTLVNNLTSATSTTGVYGYIYNTSATPDSRYGVYNWCNMPHVRKDIYVKPSSDYELAYVELIHRHHKRTPYASNAFPVESYPWTCNGQGLFYFGRSLEPSAPHSAETYWKGFTSPINPFVPPGFQGDCQFPQITSGGLEDSHQHGADLYAVYHDLLGFLPDRSDPSWREQVSYRVTTNQITSQVAGMVIDGMLAPFSPVPLRVQNSNVDSLEPAYACPSADDAFNSIRSRSNPTWQAHLAAAAPLYRVLDDISGVSPTNDAWHIWLDHYYDNLSARQCHSKPLPCKLPVDGRPNATDACVTQDVADEVYRLGHWEYSRLYRDEPASLAASAASMGVWFAELASNLRGATREGAGAGDDGAGGVRYRHNVAHDGSVSRVLSFLQVDEMVWPGMGSEVVFELYRRRGTGAAASESESESGYYVRVLWGGKVFKSSNPSLGKMDMLPVEALLEYIDGLVGVNAALVGGKCSSEG